MNNCTPRPPVHIPRYAPEWYMFIKVGICIICGAKYNNLVKFQLHSFPYLLFNLSKSILPLPPY